ncbi:MAG TPA: cation transporter [Polaromonas sp.]|uniref:cation transporter n=1 Tax=Polaromonas sp. TaxID=1869339 RepID=UPI002D4CDD1A|nr:cation transporter [Polaromonas sp.]HYW56618.1 cation transporter [Polaromonas sp.]
MSASCQSHCHDDAANTAALQSPRYRRILWFALVINFAMFAIEIGAGVQSGSASLLADAIDFLGDGANYAVSLLVLSMALTWRARAALLKGASMLLFGLFVAGRTAWGLLHGVPPEAITMGVVGALALTANLVVAWMLYAYREGDANMRSVWLCTRNDAIGNVAVMLAALGVLGTGSALPDLAVAAVMAGLAIWGGWSVVQQARQELRWEGSR